MIEASPTFTDEKDSVELYEDYRFTVFEPEKVTAEIAEKMKEVHDRALAKPPETPMQISVLLRPAEIGMIARELAEDLNYESVYSQANLRSTGDDLQEDGTGDKLTLTMRGIIEGSERSAYFDEDGTELTDTELISEGKVSAYFGSSRYGQYLGAEKPTGDLSCAEVASGTLGEKELKVAPYLECVSLSGLQLDLYNDYIGGEIRLAYYFDGEKTVPVTGITMSGKLSDALKNMRLSEKTTVHGAYRGPDKMLIPGMTIL